MEHFIILHQNSCCIFVNIHLISVIHEDQNQKVHIHMCGDYASGLISGSPSYIVVDEELSEVYSRIDKAYIKLRGIPQ